MTVPVDVPLYTILFTVLLVWTISVINICFKKEFWETSDLSSEQKKSWFSFFFQNCAEPVKNTSPSQQSWQRRPDPAASAPPAEGWRTGSRWWPAPPFFWPQRPQPYQRYLLQDRKGGKKSVSGGVFSRGGSCELGESVAPPLKRHLRSRRLLWTGWPAAGRSRLRHSWVWMFQFGGEQRWCPAGSTGLLPAGTGVQCRGSWMSRRAASSPSSGRRQCRWAWTWPNSPAAACWGGSDLPLRPMESTQWENHPRITSQPQLSLVPLKGQVWIFFKEAHLTVCQVGFL